METQQSNEIEHEESERLLKISWWKLGLGLALVLIEVKNWLTPTVEIPNALKASNQTQQEAVYAVSVVIFVAGVGFILAGLRSVWLKR